MAFDEGVAARIRKALKGKRSVEEKRMFGGIAFMVRGHMCVGVTNRDLMARVGADAYADALAQPHAREMDFTGSPLKGYVYVSEKGIATPATLQAWVDRCLAYNRKMKAR
jgi:TfoX/Sxy family transcriptional regulator of competence genes